MSAKPHRVVGAQTVVREATACEFDIAEGANAIARVALDWPRLAECGGAAIPFQSLTPCIDVKPIFIP